MRKILSPICHCTFSLFLLKQHNCSMCIQNFVRRKDLPKIDENAFYHHHTCYPGEKSFTQAQIGPRSKHMHTHIGIVKTHVWVRNYVNITGNTINDHELRHISRSIKRLLLRYKLLDRLLKLHSYQTVNKWICRWERKVAQWALKTKTFTILYIWIVLLI